MGNVLSFEIYGELKLLKKKEYGIFSKQSDLEALAQQLKKKVKGLLAVYGLLILGTILLFPIPSQIFDKAGKTTESNRLSE